MTSLIERMKTALEKATPGAWYTRLYPGTETYEVRTPGALIANVGNLGATSDHRPTAKRWKAETAANAAHIALASPSNLRSIIQALEGAERALERMADGQRLDGRPMTHPADALIDARAALTFIREVTGSSNASDGEPR